MVERGRFAMSRWTRRWGVAVGAIAVSLLGTTALAYVWADGTLHACAQKSSGQLRLVSDGQSCRDDETAVTWNVQGPPGPQGPSGPPGPPGPTAPGSIVWKDATGAVVPIVGRKPATVDAGGAPQPVTTFLFFDAAGITWAYTPPASPAVGPVYPEANQPPLLYYASSDCTGSAYVDVTTFFTARETYAVGSEIRVVNDSPPTTPLTVGSYQGGYSSMTANDGFCNATQDTRTVILVTSTYTVTAPDFPYVLPLHAEVQP
jgi:hypothetical protein